MEFAAKQTIPNSTITYAISPEIKQYTLLDLALKKPKPATLNIAGV